MVYKKIQYYNAIKSVIKEVIKDVKDIGESFCYKYIYGSIHSGDRFLDTFLSREKYFEKGKGDEKIPNKTSDKSIDNKF